MTYTLSERDDGSIDSAGSPKSDAGRRTVCVSALIVPDLVAHLAEFTDPEPSAFVFLGENGGRLRRSNFRRATHWRATVERVGLPPGFHFHDLRHTGNQLAAEAGATTRELMRRMGHSTVRAAMRYQHSTDRRDRDRGRDEPESCLPTGRHRNVSGARCGTCVARRPSVELHRALFVLVETRGIEPLTPALQRRCSAN